jgi:hypothetical protein
VGFIIRSWNAIQGIPDLHQAVPIRPKVSGESIFTVAPRHIALIIQSKQIEPLKWQIKKGTA